MKFYDPIDCDIFCTDKSIEELKDAQKTMMKIKNGLLKHEINLSDEINIEFINYINEFNKFIYKLDEKIKNYINVNYPIDSRNLK